MTSDGYCPACFARIPAAAETCPSCGAAIAQLSERDYAEKLVRALEHPLADVRMRAVTAIGMRRQGSAVGALVACALRHPLDVVQALAIVEALARLEGQGDAAMGLRALAAEHPARAVQSAAAAAGEAARGADGASTHRRLYAERFASRTREEREALARGAEGPVLAALCFDPLPAVVGQILDNPRAGLGHARLLAEHHRNGAGLELLAARAAFLRDREVQRLLLRNAQTPDAVVRRILVGRRLAEVFPLGHSHELPERHRRTAQVMLRERFAQAAPEERVELILGTEGGVLAALPGAALDGKSVGLLCSRGISSTLLIENLAHWGPTPPALVAHLLRQPLVRQSPALRTLLRRHANCPRGER